MYLQSNFPLPLVDPESSNETSAKHWAESFNSIERYNTYEATLNTFDTVFGPLSSDDRVRILKQAVEPSRQEEYVRTEGDVTRTFDRHISGAVMPAWTSPYHPTEMSLSGPQNRTSFGGTVDVQFVKLPSNPGGIYHALAVGELKAPGTIKRSWSNESTQSSGTKRLGRELRGYAYHYHCPQVFCYDGLNFLVVRFRAKNRADIKVCDADVFVLPNYTPDGGVHIRYALYRLLSDGLNRAMATVSYAVTTGSYTRNFDWFNGNPYWTAPTGEITQRYENIPGYTRIIQNGQWAWFNNGVFVAWCTAAF